LSGREDVGVSEPEPPRPRTFASTPPGFDLRSAPDEALRHHGLPRRPDAESEPRLHALWERAFRHPVEFVEAELEVDPVMTDRDRRSSRGEEFGPHNWGGLGVRRENDNLEFNEPAVMVYADFVVPHVSDENPTGEAMVVGFWVGIDGLYMAGNQVLQAGIAAKVHDNWWGASEVEYWAWTEWWSVAHKDPSHRLNNFVVRAGDPIAVLVCAQEPDYGQVTLLNRRTKKATSVGMLAPRGLQLTGSSVEWVVEGVSRGLPQFGTITFADCAAATAHGVFDLQPNGLPLEITCAVADGAVEPGRCLTRTSVTSDKLLAVEWLGFT
jgi:hypothetical protein